MTVFALYLIKVFVCSGILYAYYAWFLSNKKFHHWNRYYLLGAVVLSLLLPLIPLPVLHSDEAIQPGISSLLGTMNLQNFWLSPVTIEADATNATRYFYVLLYPGICLVLLIHFVLGCRTFLKKKQVGSGYLEKGIKLIYLEDEEGPYSFFRSLFWNPAISLDSVEGKRMLRHEMAHIEERHSLDRIALQVACCLFWYNPFFYLIKKEMCMVHEFIADEKAGGDEQCRRDYAEMMLSHVFAKRSMSFSSSYINHFFHSPVKRRFQMLIYPSSNRFSLLRKLAVIPVIALLVFSCTRQDHSKPVPPPPPPPPVPALSDIDPGDIASIDVLKNRPDSAAVIRLKDGRVYVYTEAQMAEFSMKAKPVTDANRISSNKVFTVVEQMPSFPGGNQALMEYLHDHIRYPAVARENGIKGTVVVQFIVSPDGTISNVKTVGTKKGGGLEDEAIRVVKGMPAWNPGKQNGKAVTVQYSLPIRYVLN